MTTRPGAAYDPGEDTPTCSSGPLGRLAWTARELADLLGLRNRGAWRAR